MRVLDRVPTVAQCVELVRLDRHNRGLPVVYRLRVWMLERLAAGGFCTRVEDVSGVSWPLTHRGRLALDYWEERQALFRRRHYGA